METTDDADVEWLFKSLEQLPEPEAEPSIIVVSGLPGTGKSYFSAKLAERLPAKILESDGLRKSFFPQPTYSSSESSRLFRVIHLLIKRLLKRGIPLILDATNLSEHDRERLYSIAERLSAKLILVQVVAPPAVVYRRLKARTAGLNQRDKSDADWQVYQRMKNSVQKIRRNHFVVDTSQDIEPALDKIVREARR